MAGMALIQEKCSFIQIVCIAPAAQLYLPNPEAPAGKTTTLASLLASIAGELRLVIWKSHYTVTLYKGETPVSIPAVFGHATDGDKRMEETSEPRRDSMSAR